VNNTQPLESVTKHSVPPIKMSWLTSKYVFIILILMLCLLLFVGNLTKRNMDILEANFNWVSHTQEVIALTTKTESMIKDMVSGQRGYLLTHHNEYLENFVNSASNMDNVLNQLTLMTTDNPTQQQNIVELAQLSNALRLHLNKIIDLVRQNQSDAGLALLKTGEGKQTMDAIREVIKKMLNEERRLLEIRIERAKLAVRESLIETVLITAIGAVLLIVIALLIVYYMRIRQNEAVERGKLLEYFEHKANTDFLTGLVSRSHFFELAEHELHRTQRNKKSLSVLMMDVDFFKNINDKYGHKTGDLVLQKLADVCKNELREIDIIGRIGGEEFAFVLPETTASLALEVAERIRQILMNTSMPLDQQNKQFNFTVSIGVATMTNFESTIDDLLQEADAALYQAKNSGRNKVVGIF
jgi:diguanylate cyclase (GGDEF)-like protein